MNSESILQSIFYDVDFKNDHNPHKFALLYASKLYRVINNTLRTQPVLNPGSNICKFFRRFVRYFYKHGIYSKDIKGAKLYRGFSKDFKITNNITDSAFISTSTDIDVAKRFGNVISLKVSKLPQDVPFVVIDNSIADYLHEKEIVLLPGTLSFPIPGKYSALYHPLSNIKEICVQKGDGPDMKLIIPHIELRERIVVWWRAIVGRKVEVLSWHPLPKTKKDIEREFKESVFPRDESLQNIREFIPEYIDSTDSKIRLSYGVFMAIYNMNLAKVETISWGVPAELLPEIFDVKRSQEVEMSIIKEMKPKIV